MDIATITGWLKTTIPGIILLGAFGSIIAAILIWLSKKYLLSILKKYFLAAFKKILIHFILPAANQQVRLHFLDGTNKVHIFYTLQVMKLAFSLFVATCGFILFTIALFQGGQDLYRASVLAPLIVAFLSVWYALRCLAVALIPLYFDIEKLITETKEEVLKKLKPKSS